MHYLNLDPEWENHIFLFNINEYEKKLGFPDFEYAVDSIVFGRQEENEL